MEKWPPLPNTGHIDLLLLQIECDFYYSSLQDGHELGIPIGKEEIDNLARIFNEVRRAEIQQFR